MSLLGKLFGRKTLEEERAEALRLQQAGELGLAKLSFERALERAGGDASADVKQELERAIADCCDGIARRRLQEARRLLELGELDLALAELEGAAETAHSLALIEEIEAAGEAAVRSDERAAVAAPEQSPEERFETLGGHWEQDQYEEYLAAGEPLKQALLAAYELEPQQALPELEALLSQAESPRYLLYEVGRLRLAAGDKAGGREALERFLDAMGTGQGGEARLSAHIELATLHREQDEFEQAVAQYEAAIEALPGDPRPYLAMAAFFRRAGHPEEALAVLDSVATLDSGERLSWLVAEQMGLAHADAGNRDRAIELLEQAIDQLSARGHVDLPPQGAARLAALHEEADNLPRALDLLCLLARGSDVTSRLDYQLDAARLMVKLGLAREARQMLQRASELAAESEQAKAKIAALAQQLDNAT